MKLRILKRSWSTNAARGLEEYTLQVEVGVKKSREVLKVKQVMPSGPYVEVYRRRIEREALETIGRMALEKLIEMGHG
ncbi:hypothetical protein DF152_17295 [Burkholderia cenocepacia]|nr:hypothetical protein DF152_17295 [Burkholderia cenocepacia]